VPGSVTVAADGTVVTMAPGMAPGMVMVTTMPARFGATPTMAVCPNCRATIT